jgi:hypothetical protein
LEGPFDLVAAAAAPELLDVEASRSMLAGEKNKGAAETAFAVFERRGGEKERKKDKRR